MYHKEKRIMNRINDHFYYVGATILSAGIHFLYSVFVKAHIEPLEYGIYSTCLLLSTYMTYIQLGSLNAFNRDYPQLIGAGNHKKAEEYRNTTFTFLLFIFTLTTVLISVFLLATGGGREQKYTVGFVLSSVITTVTVLENFLASRVRIDGDFRFTSFVIVAELLAVGAGFFLVPRIGYYSLFYVTMLSMLIGIGMYYKRGIADLHLSIDGLLLRSIIISGIPLLINNLIWTTVNSIDKFVILGFINTKALGLYSIAQMAFSYIILVPSAMSQLFYVKLGKVYGATESKHSLNTTAMKYMMILAVIVSFIVICAYFLMEIVVAWMMPKYEGGVKAAQILMLGLAIYSPTMVSSNILTILKKNAALLRGSVYLCVLNTICSVGLVVLRGATIENVAIGTAVSYLIRTVILIYQLKKNAESNVIHMLKASVFPILFTVGPGVLIYHVINHRIIGFVLAVIIAGAIMGTVYRKDIINVVNVNCNNKLNIDS